MRALFVLYAVGTCKHHNVISAYPCTTTVVNLRLVNALKRVDASACVYVRVVVTSSAPRTLPENQKRAAAFNLEQDFSSVYIQPVHATAAAAPPAA